MAFEVTDGGKHGKLFSVKRSSSIVWASDGGDRNRLLGTDKYDGAYNMAKVKQIPNWRYRFPPFAWCADLGEGWYLPAKAELEAVLRNREAFDEVLKPFNEKLSEGYCWSSAEYNGGCAWCVGMLDGSTNYDSKSSSTYVRAVSAF